MDYGTQTPQVLEATDRAQTAARSVVHQFGQKLFFLPGTHIGAIRRPTRRIKSLFSPWHYWWQAHYVDALVDAGQRELATGVKFDGASRPSAGRLASRLVTTIRLRNFLTFVNSYYDDMAWLALSSWRLEQLAEKTRNPGRRRNARLLKTLSLQFDSASTDDLGGGTFWSKKRDFKNTPATAPVALHFARTGRRERAQALVDWLDAKLFDASQGMYLDGLRIRAGGEIFLENAIYTYNQGPILGALLELGGPVNLERAEALIRAIDARLTLAPEGNSPVPMRAGARILRCDGTGDGGLFTGILVRYLALAANDSAVSTEARSIAATLVRDTAEALWQGRRPAGEGAPDMIFSTHPLKTAAQTYPAGAVVELSTQLQAWMIFEAAASLGTV
ncbi:glycoside hydrolase family 76 protein [Pseudarthrobacter sp. J1763]|uniref:glycoside hydrolase family 76 protein n=1 Tax=Pseudarthrobacter sp. J1763 TaxID=3420445 RepID=UPI003D28F5B0